MTLKQLLTGGPQPPWLRWVFLIGLAAVVTRLILDSSFGTTTIFYVATPYLIGLAIYLAVPPSGEMTKMGRALRHMRSASIVMFASSLLIFEGWICILFAFPIYLLFAGIVLALMPPPRHKPEDITDVFRAGAAPLLVAAITLHGLYPGFQGEREQSVTRTRVIAADISEIKAKLAEPIVYEETRSRFLSLFPLPHTTLAGTLSEGDIHHSHFTYRRWPVGNTHHGIISVQLAKVGEQNIRTRVIRNDAYFSQYLTIHGTRIDMEPLADGTTRLSLSIDYRRDLDPAWYFGPLQKRAVGESADYLIDQLMVPDG